MATYAKINQYGEVLEVPYQAVLDIEYTGAELPEDAVEVDVSTNYPTDKRWYQGAWIDGCDLVDGNYVATYTVADIDFDALTVTDADGVETNVGQDNKRAMFANVYARAVQRVATVEDAEVRAADIDIIESIDVNDENTWDNYYNLSFT